MQRYGYEEERRLIEAVRCVLAERGPMTSKALAAALAGHGLQLGEDAEELVDDLLIDEAGTLDLPDGRWVDVESLLDGRTFTHRLSEEEARDEIVVIDPDLAPLLATEADAFPTAGGEARVVDEPFGVVTLAGPTGWLGGAAPGDLLAFRLDRGVLGVAPVAGPLADPAEAAARLEKAFVQMCGGDDAVGASMLAMVALVDSPFLFRGPLPPLPEIYELAGLDVCGEWVGEAGGDWDSPELDFDFDVADELDFDFDAAEALGLDEPSAQALGLVLGAYELASMQGLDELADQEEVVAALAMMLSMPGVVELFLIAILGEDPGEEPVVTAFVEALASVPGTPGPHYVLARCAEHRGEVAACEAHLRAALAADPDFPSALVDAAWYAADRGDAAVALSGLRRAGVDPDEPLVVRLERFAAPGPATARRNEPCPCGSGRKYKVCCVRRNGHPLHERAGWLHRKALQFLLRPPQWPVLWEMALARTGGDPDDSAKACAQEDSFVQDLALFDTEVFTTFLDVRGELLPADELALGRSWAGRRRSLYEVTDVRPGEGLTLRDLRTGDRFEVTERLGSGYMQPGGLLYGRVVPDGRSHQLLGGISTIPFTLRDRLLAFLDTEPGPEETAAWLTATEAPPTLSNVEGEPMMLCSARFAVPDVEAADRGLGEVFEQVDGRYLDHIEVDGQPIVRGWARWDGGELVMETNSEARFERLRDVILGACDAWLVEERRQTLEDFMAEASSDLEPAADLPLEAMVSADKHIVEAETRWVDEPIPALGGVAPRDAAADPTRRGDLEALLDEFEAENERLPEGFRSFNVGRLRRRLGLVR
ncbi:MAG: SEC-C metal-binding domain-containing protein [Egibacteraceae bacterium]